MAKFIETTANIRLMNEDKKSVCLLNNVLPNVSADTAMAFVSAIETLYNSGPCKAQLRVAYDSTIGTRRSFRINNPTTGLPIGDIENAVAQMMDNDIFNPAKGGIESFNKLELVSIDRTTVM